jgi:alkylation response protein AidB-like acyl-CoA dehydrogenase
MATSLRQRTAAPPELFDIAPTDEQRMLSNAVGEFATARLRPAAPDADERCATPQQLLDQAAELGLAGVGIPTELGGSLEQRSAVTSALIAEALAHGDMGIALACLAPGAVATALALWGDAEQQRYLPEFASARPPGAALALLEPRPLFDPLAPRASAHRTGRDIVLDGVKSLVPGAAGAQLLVVGAMLDGEPSLLVVETPAAGVSIEPEPAMGLRAAATATVSFDAVRLGAGALLGDAAAYRQCVQLARLGWCALAIGTCQAVLDYVRGYVVERVAFGEPIANRQAVAFAVANIAIELEGMRLATYRAAGLIDTGQTFTREVTLARSLVARHGMAIGSEGVQLLGGHGYTKEHPVERWYRDLRAAGLMEGALLL